MGNAAGVPREANTAVGQELGRLDSVDRVFHQLAKFLALLVGDGGLKILNFDESLSDEHNLDDFGNTG